MFTLDSRQSGLLVGLVVNECIYKVYRQTCSDLLLPPFQNTIRRSLVFYADVCAVTSSAFANVFDLRDTLIRGGFVVFRKGGDMIIPWDYDLGNPTDILTTDFAPTKK